MRHIKNILYLIIFLVFVVPQRVKANSDSTWFSVSAAYSVHLDHNMSPVTLNPVKLVKFQPLEIELHRSWYGASVWYGVVRNFYYSSSSDNKSLVPQIANGFASGINALALIVSRKNFRLQLELGLQYFEYAYISYVSQYRGRAGEEYYNFSKYNYITANSFGYNLKVTADFRIYKSINLGLFFHTLQSSKFGVSDLITLGVELKYDI